VRAWLDFDNAPQVQYLAPFKQALEDRGHSVVVTARDQDVTVELLRARGIEPIVVGGPSGARAAAKIGRLLVRAGALGVRVSRPRPDLLVAASRSSDVAAWALRIPSFQFTDYEFSDDRVTRVVRSHLVFPDVIDSRVFLEKGIRPDRLLPFPGLKEGITFAGADLASVEPYAVPGGEDAVRVLFRPPGEATHYFVADSRRLAHELLAELAGRDVLVVYAPRYPHQRAYVDGLPWRRRPHVLSEGVPFLRLLTGVDAVISSGGTLLREAAYLGIPAFSILRSQIGRVDRHLEELGRVSVLASASELPPLARRGPLAPLQGEADLPNRILDEMLARVERS